MQVVATFNGSVSAEHGVGLLKKDYLPFTKSDSERAMMRNIKRVYDPDGVMNPGKIFD
jgi:FAD/FMN-containing dehydrogenase